MDSRRASGAAAAARADGRRNPTTRASQSVMVMVAFSATPSAARSDGWMSTVGRPSRFFDPGVSVKLVLRNERAGADATELQDVGDEPLEPVRLVVDGLEQLGAVVRIEARLGGAQRRRGGLDRRERRSQVVGDRRQEARARAAHLGLDACLARFGLEADPVDGGGQPGHERLGQRAVVAGEGARRRHELDLEPARLHDDRWPGDAPSAGGQIIAGQGALPSFVEAPPSGKHSQTIDERLVGQLEGESPSPEPGYLVTKKILATGRPFTALFAFNDISAIGAIRALREAGRSVPEDVSVVGFDDIQSAAFQNPALTTVRQPLRNMGIIAAETLLRRINAPAKSPYPKSILVEPELIVRGTTARPRYLPD